MTEASTATTEESIEKKLTPEEVSTLVKMHKDAQELVNAIGQSEIRKQRMLVQLANIEEQAQGIMNSASARMGIAPGTPWQMSPDGAVVILDPKTGQPVQA